MKVERIHELRDPLGIQETRAEKRRKEGITTDDAVRFDRSGHEGRSEGDSSEKHQQSDKKEEQEAGLNIVA